MKRNKFQWTIDILKAVKFNPNASLNRLGLCTRINCVQIKKMLKVLSKANFLIFSHSKNTHHYELTIRGANWLHKAEKLMRDLPKIES